MNKLKIIVATSAFNEENNIKVYIKSVLKQNTPNFKLEKILIVSDGSNDGTVQIVEKFKSKKIRIIDYKIREGKSKRLNQIFKNLTSDLLVLFDADIIIPNNRVVENLLKPFEDKNIGLVGGNMKPLKGRNLVERSINCGARIYERLRAKGYYPSGFDGRILAMSKKFARCVKIPEKMPGSDEFLYLIAHKLGFNTKYQKNAVVFYKSPSTIKDQIYQNTRFTASHKYIKKLFGNNFPESYKLPLMLYLQETSKELIYHPKEVFLIFIINTFCRIKLFISSQNLRELGTLPKVQRY